MKYYKEEQTATQVWLTIIKKDKWEWLQNKFPTDVEFHGNALQASVKNFQIVHESDTDYIIMQVGNTYNKFEKSI